MCDRGELKWGEGAQGARMFKQHCFPRSGDPHFPFANMTDLSTHTVRFYLTLPLRASSLLVSHSHLHSHPSSDYKAQLSPRI